MAVPITISADERARLGQSAARLDAWIERQGFAGWDPFDALNSPLLRALAFGRRKPGIVWVQALKRLPFNLRPLLGVRKGYNPKGMGLFLATYVRKFRCSGDATHRARVEWLAQWLLDNAAPGYHGACWGYNFPWPNRAFYAPTGTPTAVNTAFIAGALLDAYETLGDERYRQAALSSARFFLKDLNRLEEGDGLCFSYTPLDRSWVYNASILAAATLARIAGYGHMPEAEEAACRAANFVLAHQRPDGAWVYGTAGNQGWVDGYHTGYVLEALADLYIRWGRPLDAEPLRRGYQYYLDHFFSADGMPHYYDTMAYPVESHAGAQAILTFLRYRTVDPDAVTRAFRVAGWLVDHMQSPDGSFCYQKLPGFSNRIPYMRWTEAWVQRAFTELQTSVPS